MARLNIPDEVYNLNWIVDFYNGCICFAELLSSVIQGSSFGPASYIVTAIDLRPQHADSVQIFLGFSSVKYGLALTLCGPAFAALAPDSQVYL